MNWIWCLPCWWLLTKILKYWSTGELVIEYNNLGHVCERILFGPKVDKPQVDRCFTVNSSSKRPHVKVLLTITIGWELYYYFFEVIYIYILCYKYIPICLYIFLRVYNSPSGAGCLPLFPLCQSLGAIWLSVPAWSLDSRWRQLVESKASSTVRSGAQRANGTLANRMARKR